MRACTCVEQSISLDEQRHQLSSVSLEWVSCLINTFNADGFQETNMYLHFSVISWMAQVVNSLWPSDIIWWQGSRSTLAQVMACCLTAPSHYLNQCWLMISEVLWHSSDNKYRELHLQLDKYNQWFHYYDVTWASQQHKWLATQRFVQQLPWLTTKKKSKLYCELNLLVTRGFPSQRASNLQSISMS